MKKPKQIHEALQAIDEINDFIQALKEMPDDDDIANLCSEEIARIKRNMPPTIAQRTVSRYQSVVKSRLGANHPAVTLLVWGEGEK
jgi:hypothetical protein